MVRRVVSVRRLRRHCQFGPSDCISICPKSAMLKSSPVPGSSSLFSHSEFASHGSVLMPLGGMRAKHAGD